MKLTFPYKILKTGFYLLLTLFIALILFVSVRGQQGNPNGIDLNTESWREGGPFELSPERGRYALLYSIVEDKSLQFSTYMGQFASPDVAVSNGRFVSLFAPLLSFTAIPGYMVGKAFGSAQFGSFAVVALFAIFNYLLIRAIAIRLGARAIASTIGAMMFTFASPAFAYGVTLYQHHLSTFLMLAGIYALLRFNNFFALLVVFLTFALSIPLDYPNLFFISPIAIYALGRIFSFSTIKEKFLLKINLWTFITPIIMIFPIAFFLWFNQTSYGDPFQLSGTLPTAQLEQREGQKLDLTSAVEVSTVDSKGNKNVDKSAVHFFDSRPILDGLFIHFISPDRGMIYYTPVMTLGFIGFILAVKKKVQMVSLFAAIAGSNIILYSMWGDPWGGWAFGSRYLIPAYAILAVYVSLLLTYWSKKIVFLIIFAILAFYSVAVNTLGAITTNAIPPKVEVLELEKLSGTIQKYTYGRNWDFLVAGNSKSFIYQTYLDDRLTAVQFYQLLTISILTFVGLLLLGYAVVSRKEGRQNV